MVWAYSKTLILQLEEVRGEIDDFLLETINKYLNTLEIRILFCTKPWPQIVVLWIMVVVIVGLMLAKIIKYVMLFSNELIKCSFFEE